MKINKDKKQKKLERFFITPNYTAVLGLTVKKNTDIEDEFEKSDEVSKMTVKQTIHGTKFKTEKILETTLQNGEKMKEITNIELDLNEGTRLIWLDGKGYVLPNENFQTMEEIRRDIEYLKDL
ncbi:MAG: hypothetical protein K1W33_07110 [Clostridia bacterium]